MSELKSGMSCVGLLLAERFNKKFWKTKRGARLMFYKRCKNCKKKVMTEICEPYCIPCSLDLEIEKNKEVQGE